MSAHHTVPAPTDDVQKAQNKPQSLLDHTPSRQDGQTFYTMEPPAVILHDPNVTFEEYLYWAEVTRAEEKLANERYLHSRGPVTLKSVVKDRFRKGDEHVRFQGGSEGSGNEDVGAGAGEKQNGSGSDKALHPAESRDGGVVTPEEWKTASRAVRTAGWGAVFYLITTDILGPFSTPWVYLFLTRDRSVTNMIVQLGLCADGLRPWYRAVHRLRHHVIIVSLPKTTLLDNK